MENSSKCGLINWLAYTTEPNQTAYGTAEGMLRLLMASRTPPEYLETRVLAEYQGVSVEAVSGDTVDSVVSKWAEARALATWASQRVEPVRVAIAYLLDSLSEEDRDFLVRNFKYIEKKEDGVLCLR
jgi:hypothetical protein